MSNLPDVPMTACSTWQSIDDLEWSSLTSVAVTIPLRGWSAPATFVDSVFVSFLLCIPANCNSKTCQAPLYLAEPRDDTVRAFAKANDYFARFQLFVETMEFEDPDLSKMARNIQTGECVDPVSDRIAVKRFKRWCKKMAKLA